MQTFKITLEAKGKRPQVLTEKDENIRAVIDAWLYMFEQAGAAQHSVQRTDGGLCLDCGHSVEIKQVAGCLDHPVRR